MSEPIFLTLDQTARLHARSLAEHGGSEGTRDLGLVESALASAKNTYSYAHGDVFDVAASYAFHLAQAQAFLDGNKRTAVASALVFLATNGVICKTINLGCLSGHDSNCRKENVQSRIGGYLSPNCRTTKLKQS